MAAVSYVGLGAHFVEFLAIYTKIAVAVVAVSKCCGFGGIFGIYFVLNVIVAANDTEVWFGIE